VWQNTTLRQAAASYEARFEICVHIDTSLSRLTQSPREKQFRLRSKVLNLSICCSFFRSQSEKTNNKKEEKYRCEHPQVEHRASRVF